MFDVLIAGGTVVDGSGTPGYRADVGIEGESIQVIGDLRAATGRRVIDATGLVVSPGFIDTHTHSEGPLLHDPQHANGLRQGITTEIMALDGVSYAPLSPEKYRSYRRYLSGLLGSPPDDLDTSSVAAFRARYHKRVAINTAYLVPHGAVRLEVLGFRDTPLVGNDLEQAKRMVKEGIEEGAVGLSTGLSYYPGTWSDTQELIELCKAGRDAGGVYVTELRKINTDRAFGDGGVAEALETARRSGVKLHFAHYRTAPDTAGKTGELLELIDQAKAEGVDCTMDIYPYPAGSSFPVGYLPGYVNEGGTESIIRHLKDPSERAGLLHYLESRPFKSLDEMVFTYLPQNSQYEGMSLPEVADIRGASMQEVLLDLLLEEDLEIGYLSSPPRSVALWRQVSRDSMELLARPDYMVCSDITPMGSLPHPRCYGAFPRFLGRLRRQFGGLSLEQMVHRMTARAAERFGMKGRGLLRGGNYADIVVFDAVQVNDTATYDDPCQFPTGIPYVLVNGQVAVDQERCTGVMAGQAVP